MKFRIACDYLQKLSYPDLPNYLPKQITNNPKILYLLTKFTLMTRLRSKQLSSWGTLFILAVVWGSSFILIKRGLEYFSSLEIGALRIIITFLVLLPFAIKRFRKLKKRDWIVVGIVGLIGSGFPPFLFAEAQTGIDSYLAGILNSLTPLFTLLISTLFFRFKSRWFNRLGILIGLAGATGLLISTGGTSFEFHLFYAGLVVIATICYATNVNLVKYLLVDLDAISITVFSFFIIGIPALIFLLFFTDFIPNVIHTPGIMKGFGYIAILAVVGTAGALILFNKLIKIASPLFASSVTYLIPVVAILWGIVDNERFEFVYLLWILIVLGGVFLVNLKRS
jgi:drug/metabolite transporter (DMT)-like permease